jgi:Tfp pilus assembly protein PilO
VIKPNLTTVFNIEKELAGLKKIDESYTDVVNKIINIQMAVEETRETVWVLDEGLPHQPNVNQLIEEIKRISQENRITISSLKISEINLKEKETQNNFKKISIDMTTQSPFEDIYQFILALFEQRRLKSIDSITFSKSDKTSSESATVDVKFIINSYYL